MNEPIADLQKLERDAFRRFYEDGIFDIYLGVMLLVFFAASALWEALENELVSYVTMLGLALLITVPLLAYRRRLLRERLGTFRPGRQRRLRISRTRWVLLGSVVLGLLIFGLTAVTLAGPESVDWLALVVPAVWFVNAILVFGVMAYNLDVPRFYVYGFVAGLLMPLMVWPDVLWGVELPAWIVFGSAGVAVAAYGVVKLRRFLRRYPAPQHGWMATDHEVVVTASVDRLIHEPARLAIMTNLFVVESANATYLLQQSGLTWGNLGSHLAKLEEAGYVEVTKGYNGRKPETTVRLTGAGRIALVEYRERLLKALAPIGGS